MQSYPDFAHGAAFQEALSNMQIADLQREYSRILNDMQAQLNAWQARAAELQQKLNEVTMHDYAESALTSALMEEARIVKVAPNENLLFTSFYHRERRDELRQLFKRMSAEQTPFKQAKERGIMMVRKAHGFDERSGMPLAKQLPENKG